MKKSKKIVALSLALLLTMTFATGCGKEKKEDLTKKYEAAMEKYAKEYYTNFMNKSLDIPVVELKALRKANETGQANYDLKDLEKCEDESYVTLTVNKESKVVEGYEHHLTCK